MQRHSGRDGVGVLWRTEESVECVGTGRDRQRQSSTAEWGKKGAREKKRKKHICGRTTVADHVRLHIRVFLDHPWTKCERPVCICYPVRAAGEAFTYLTVNRL